MLSSTGLSIQAKNPHRTAIDQRREQCINILKLTLNRAYQSANTSELKSMTGINQENFVYKSLRPSEIIKSEQNVQRIVKVLKEEEYINPFSAELYLYNLSSGLPVPEDLAE